MDLKIKSMPKWNLNDLIICTECGAAIHRDYLTVHYTFHADLVQIVENLATILKGKS